MRTQQAGLGRRATLALLAAGLPLAARAQLTPAIPPSPQAAPPPPPPQVTIPAAPAPIQPPRPVLPLQPAAIDKSKVYYVFFEQQIDVNTMRGLRRQLATLAEAGVAQVTLVIDSPGGQVEPMLVTYSFIRALPMTVNTHAQGFVQSAATALFLAGQDRSADRNARFLFHQATAIVTGTLNEVQLRERVTAMQNVEAAVDEIYQDRTKLSDDQVKQFSNGEVIFTAEQARQQGIVNIVADLKIPGGDSTRMLFLD